MRRKKEVWKNKESYIGRYIEYKGLMVGAKDLPRHPVYLRMRDDKAWQTQFNVLYLWKEKRKQLIDKYFDDYYKTLRKRAFENCR